MGNARSSTDSLMYFRSWTASEVSEVQETLRRRKAVLSVDRATFDALIGVQNRDSVQVFDLLDSDCDGLVDTFEVLLTLTLWSCASWEEKLNILFRCYDFNLKGALRFPELALLVSTAARVLGRFGDVPAWTADARALNDAALAAFGGSVSAELASDAFSEWFGSSDVTQQLRDFVDASLSQEAPEAVEALVRERVRFLEYRVQELSHEITRLQETSTAMRNEDQPKGTKEQEKRAEALWGNVDGLVVRLTSANEAQRSELQELADMLNREVASGGVAALLEPSTRSGHGRLIAEIDALERRARTYLEQAKVALGEIVELRGTLEEEHSPEGLLPPLPAQGDGEETEAKARRLRLLDREVRRRRGKQPVAGAEVPHAQTPPPPQVTAQAAAVQTSARTSPAPSVEAGRRQASEAGGAGGVTAGGAGGVTQGSRTPEADEQEREDPLPVVVVFAAFQPPDSNDTLMLTLSPGDEITALGQDGQGWWYGRMVATGQEGWFPPSYVQLKDEAAGGAAGPPKAAAS